MKKAIAAGVEGFVPLRVQRDKIQNTVRSFFDGDEQWHVDMHDITNSEQFIVFAYHEGFPEMGLFIVANDTYFAERYLTSFVMNARDQIMEGMKAKMAIDILPDLPEESVPPDDIYI